MRTTFISLFSLFASCFILFLGNGLINVLLPVRMGLDGINTDTIGMVLSLYFVGLLLGALYSVNLIRRAGHIRMFAGCVALGSVSILVCSLYSEPLLWGVMRVVIGFCNACAMTAMESWLSSCTTKGTRGKVLAVYNSVVLGGLFGGQFLMNFFNPQDTTLFVIAGILLCTAVIPLVLSRHPGPMIEEVEAMPLRALYKISPLGVVSCLISGLVYSAIFNLLPVFGKEYNIVDFQLSLYIGTAILGAFILQFPVGYLSDRYDRRTVLLSVLLISAVADIAVTVLASVGALWAVFITTAITSGIIACTYPLSISETFDKLRQSEMVAAMGSMILAFSIGGIIGPYTASIMMSVFGSAALFYFLALIQLLLAGFVMYRMNVRQALPVEDQEHFVMQGAGTSTAIDLDPRTEYFEPELALSAEAKTAMAVAETDPAAAVKMAQAIAKTNPALGMDIAGALATTEDINVLRLYEAMKEALPQHSLDITGILVKAKPELAYELVRKLAEWYPDQVVSVAAEIGRTLPDLRIEMARIAVESAPNCATEVAEYYAKVLAEELDALRPADREDEYIEEDAVNIVSELWQSVPEQALDVAVAMVDAVPEAAVPVAEEYMSSQCSDEFEEDYISTVDLSMTAEQPEAEYQDTVELVSRLAEVAPSQAVDIAVAVLEINPGSASEVVNAISAGDEAKDSEWVLPLDDKSDTAAT